MINGHGDDYQGELKGNFSSNVWLGTSNAALKLHLWERMQVIDRYPEPNAVDLRERMAAVLGVAPNEILVTNGSVEAFYLLAQAFEGSLSVIKTPTFSEYADACRLFSHTTITSTKSDLNDVLSAYKPQLIWICNPNNPDGNTYSIDYLRTLFVRYPHTIFVVDQAYKDFSTHSFLPASDIATYPNLVLIQSLTKRYAIPGLRLGYVLANEALITRIAGFQQPWSVNALALEAAKFLFDGYGDDFKLEAWLVEARWFQAKINEIANFEVIPSDLPYFLVALKHGKAADLKQFLLCEQLLVRDATNFEGLEGEYIRVCTLARVQNNLLIQELTRWSQQFIR